MPPLEAKHFIGLDIQADSDETQFLYILSSHWTRRYADPARNSTISLAERNKRKRSERMHKLAQEYAGRFAEDFNKEIQNAYFNFDVSADDWRALNYHPFLERYDFWRGKTAYPDLIREFYFFDAAGKNTPLRYDASARTFVAADWTPELREIFNRTQDQKNFLAVNDDIYTLILPEHEAPSRIEHMMVRRSGATIALAENKEPEPPVELDAPKTYGYLAIRLDESVIRDRILPEIAAKDFTDSNFQLRVSDRDGGLIYQTANFAGNADAQAGLFDLSPTDMYFFANRDLADAVTERRETVMTTTRVENQTRTRTEFSNRSQGTVRVEIAGDKPKSQIFTTAADRPDGHWTLAASTRPAR